MARLLLLLFGVFSFQLISAQEFNKQDTLKIDIDLDQKTDTIIFDRTKAVIVCKLSSSNFKNIQSLELAFEEPQSKIREAGNGFTYVVPFMRAGYHADFKYNKKAGKIQLVAMDRYEFGPANNDGSGESSVDLLTNKYEGSWNYYDVEKRKLVKIPTIKAPMFLPETFLENFSDEIVYRYMEMCSNMYLAQKNKLYGRKIENVVWKNYHPFSDKTYVVSIKKTEDVEESEIYFLKQTAQSTKIIWQEKITINFPKVEANFDDFNGDGIKDLLIFSTTGARGNNEFYYLYLVKGNQLIKVKNFENVVNPQYDKQHKVIIAYGYAGTNNYSIYKISTDYKAVQIGESFTDDFDSDTEELNKRIEQLLKKHRQ